MMNILHLSTSDLEGGAARAAYRLHQGLNDGGISSQMLVRAKRSIDCSVIAEKSLLTKVGPLSNSLPLKLYPRRGKKLFFSQWFPDNLAKKVREINPDLIHLHWVCNGFVRIETLSNFSKPMVWTLHDMWPFTGGCNYSESCDLYTDTCGNCPQLNSDRCFDLSRSIWQRKQRSWQNIDLTVVSPSIWLAECARSSSLFQSRSIHVIPHGLDLTKYKPIDRHIAREILNLPDDRTLILFGASPGTTKSSRKGFHLLREALASLREVHGSDTIELALLGALKPPNPENFGFPTHYLGQVHDDVTLAMIYSAVDVTVVPSLQEAFGQMATESLACGTPVVTFNATGLKDIVEHQQNGYLVKPFDSDDLARGIAWVLDDRDRHRQLKIAARAKAEREFSLELQASRYVDLFTEILERNTTEN